MNVKSWPTPRDLLDMDPNPARIPIKAIVAKFGIGHRSAQELRTIATRAPEVLEREFERLRQGQGGK